MTRTSTTIIAFIYGLACGILITAALALLAYLHKIGGL